MSKCAIVIMYDGSEPNKLTMTRIVEALSKSGYVNNTQTINAFFLNELDVISAIVGAASSKSAAVREEGFNDEERAVILIGTVCPSIRGDVEAFTIELARAYMHALVNRDNPELVDAVRILVDAKSVSNIRAKLKNDYNFYADRYKAVCNIYKAACLGHIGE